MVHFSECSTVATNCNAETQIEMRDGTVEHFPEGLVGAVDRHARGHEVLVPVARLATGQPQETLLRGIVLME